ncbi:MAG: retropepsin-like domain-containing protein [Nanoarchaeota archaeon]|nr:retropepsin-like domain-containing protein [Nanoarchaeota archaeon]
MVLSFNYHQLPNKKGSDIRTPTIPVTLKGKSEAEIRVYALIDSGADISVIPKALAEVLNLDLSGKSESSYGIGGEIKVKTSKMGVTVAKGHEKYNFMVPVQIILGGEEPPIILGRRGFFENFIVTLDESTKKIKLKKVVRLH